ncbi:hypothetical protein E8E13_011326 [Curvularia kusanoi]|uniref:Uncharacterized protein n=1 Tax=Curvularia kusanoi TaxID=90978 RepID=A0A9P4TMM9_CURKU|nr:hypothetical protein E8E13_011326 [Curvularia kusanoi]
MTQQPTGGSGIPGVPFNDTEGVPEVSNLRRVRSAASDRSDAARSSTQVDLEKTQNRVRTRRTSGDEPNGFLKGVYRKWKTAWRLQTTIIGLFTVSMACAYMHWLFFEYLDGRILAWIPPTTAAKTTMIQQGYATTISFLLTTAFKAALVGSVGICYTQSLWVTLRKRVLKIGLIEDLFQIQTNALHLISSGVYLKTPVLAAIAVFCWVVPVAMIYPPGALIVELDYLQINTTQRVPTFHASNPFNGSWAPISCIGSKGIDELGNQQQNASFLKTCKLYLAGPGSNAVYVARSSLLSGELASLSQPGGSNSSYTVKFWGTKLDCDTTDRIMETRFDPERLKLSDDYLEFTSFQDCSLSSDAGSAAFEETRISYRSINGSDSSSEPSVPPESYQYQYFPCLDENNPVIPLSGISVVLPVVKAECRPKIVRYSVTVSSDGSRQRVSTTFEDEDAKSTPRYTYDFGSFNGSFEQWVQFSDAATIYREFAENLDKSMFANANWSFTRPFSSNGSTAYNLSDGTLSRTCTLGPVARTSGDNLGDYEIWPLSVFQRRLPLDYKRVCPRFDAQMANDLLVNTTISALALSENFGNVEGTETRVFNIYRFKNKLSFFIPYGLAIALGIPIIVLGLVSFHIQNEGISAINGGFLQLLMTTTGRTDLEDIVHKTSGTLGGYENASDKLKAVEVRFGELVEVRDRELSQDSDRQTSDTNILQGSQRDRNDEVEAGSRNALGKNVRSTGRAGFGLAHEVRSLRRRNVE